MSLLLLELITSIINVGYFLSSYAKNSPFFKPAIVFHVDVLVPTCYHLSALLDQGFNAIIIFAVKPPFQGSDMYPIPSSADYCARFLPLLI